MRTPHQGEYPRLPSLIIPGVVKNLVVFPIQLTTTFGFCTPETNGRPGAVAHERVVEEVDTQQLFAVCFAIVSLTVPSGAVENGTIFRSVRRFGTAGSQCR